MTTLAIAVSSVNVWAVIGLPLGGDVGKSDNFQISMRPGFAVMTGRGIGGILLAAVPDWVAWGIAGPNYASGNWRRGAQEGIGGWCFSMRNTPPRNVISR